MDYGGHFFLTFLRERSDLCQRRENPRAWTASGFEVCSSNLAAARFNMEKENPRKETEFVSEEDTSSFRMK